MTHPSSLDLEAFALQDAGDTRSTRTNTAAHVHACAACAAFVEKVRTLLSGGPTAVVADDAVARALARISSEAAPNAAPPARARTASRSSEERAREARATPAKTNAHEAKRRLWLVTTSVLTPLAAAAAILLLTRSQSLPSGPVPAGPSASALTSEPPGDRILMGKQPHAPGVDRGDPDTTFKGGPQIAVVRERAGRQERFVSVVPVRAGDRLRVEVALDREQAILGAVLADDGSYLELMPRGIRGAGTHFSEKSAKIDDSPTRGTILIGTPEAVARARDSARGRQRQPTQQGEAGETNEPRQFDGVSTIRVRVEEEVAP